MNEAINCGVIDVLTTCSSVAQILTGTMAKKETRRKERHLDLDISLGRTVVLSHPHHILSGLFLDFLLQKV